MKLYSKVLWLALLFMLLPAGAQAYLGPGLGAGTIAVVLGLIGSVFLALFAVLWYPIKRIIQKLRPNKKKAE